MKHLTLLAVFSVIAISSISQTQFDSVFVHSKLTQYLQSKRTAIPEALQPSVAPVTIESRVDFSSDGFDFKKADNPAYLKQKSRDVMVLKFADIKLNGSDIYIKTSTTKYPLTNMEMQADARGGIVKDLPFTEISTALALLDSKQILTLQQVEENLQQLIPAGFTYTHASFLIDLRTQVVHWQLQGKPDSQTQRQELLELDAVTGAIISREFKPMNLTAAPVTN